MEEAPGQPLRAIQRAIPRLQMASQDLKRTYTDMNGSGSVPNGSITTRNQQQQQQQAHTNAQAAKLQQQHRQSMLNGNQHGLAHTPNAQKRKFTFAETTEEILKKYENATPSLDFHIHENHYRFGTQDGIISKNSHLVKDFLEYVAKGEIPYAIVEVLRDAGIVFYEGCLILLVLDHRKTVELETTNEKGEKEKKLVPRLYRTLLRPTQLSLFYDLLSQTDSALQRFTDQLGLSMESEILTLTNRKLNLKVPLNPYKCTAYVPELEYPRINRTNGEILHDHRVECSDPRSKAFHPVRELHEDSPQQNSEYERFMLTLSDRASLAGEEATQFTRLRFVEQFRLNKEKLKNASMNAPLSNRPFNNNGGPTTNLTPLQQQQLQQKRMQQIQQQQQQQQKAFAQQQLQQQNAAGTMDSVDSKKKGAKRNNNNNNNSPMKKNVAGKTLPGYSDKTLPGAGSPEEPPKKKRGTYKKKTNK